jgi:predicted PurR-regulated permease PerM
VNDTVSNFPFYVRASIILIGSLALFAILYIGQDIIIPLVFAIILAIVLHPVVVFFVRLRVNRVVAISFTLLLSVMVIAAFLALVVSQASRFTQSWPLLLERLTQMVNGSIVWAAWYFDSDPQVFHDWLNHATDELLNISTLEIGETLVMIGSGVMVTFLIPVYVFIILYYQPLILEFIRKLFRTESQETVRSVVSQTKVVVQRYLIGLVIEFVLVAILNTVALLILGIDYAILLGVLGALLNLIPYIGGVVGVALPMMVAIATKSSGWYAIYVLGLYTFIQLIDNNYIVPIIVSSKVKINALFSIVVVIAGNALWGISGMFLSIPLLAIVKLTFDHIEPLKPWGFLLGDTMPPLLKIKPFRLMRIKKFYDDNR